MNIDQATVMYKNFLEFRKKYHVDEIRQEILYGGRNTPWKFPKAKSIIGLAPQIVVTSNATDKEGNPLGKALPSFFPLPGFNLGPFSLGYFSF